MSQINKHGFMIIFVILLMLTVSIFAFYSAHRKTVLHSVSSIDNRQLIEYNSIDGKKLFYQSRYNNSFFALSPYFVTQKNLTFCGVASAVMVLNALDLKHPPVDSAYTPYRFFTQNNIFTDQVKSVVNIAHIKKSGLTLNEFGLLVKKFPVEVTIVHANESSFNDFHERALKALKQENTFVVVNFGRKDLYHNKGGHFSPLGMYDLKTDRFLLLDVARYRYPPVWMHARDLWSSMNTLDADSGEFRGFAIISAAGHRQDIDHQSST
jgi:hypothetical protein